MTLRLLVAAADEGGFESRCQGSTSAAGSAAGKFISCKSSFANRLLSAACNQDLRVRV